MAQVRAAGGRGYRYLFPQWINGFMNYYVKDRNATYTYDSRAIVSAGEGTDGLQTALNQYAGQGYRWLGNVLPSVAQGDPMMLFEKDASSVSYQYVVTPVPAGDLVAALNARGTDGYLLRSMAFAFGTSMVSVFEKSNTGAKYVYEAVDPATSEDSQGARGFVRMGSISTSVGWRTIYVRDTTQNATFTWSFERQPTSHAALLEQFNAKGAQGWKYMHPDAREAGTYAAQAAYARSSNCSGVLCGSGPLWILTP